jgi:hypothetical protein
MHRRNYVVNVVIAENLELRVIVVSIYSGCQKNVPVFERFFLQPLMPNFLISEHYYGKRYNLIIRSLHRTLNGQKDFQQK